MSFGLLSPGRSGVHIIAEDNSSVEIHGTDFNLPFGAITPLSGAVSGTLTDGTEFEWTFRRNEAATILLVPEPSSTVGMCLAAIFVIGRRPRAQQRQGHYAIE